MPDTSKFLNFDNNLEHISGMDATFIYLERPNSPMHVGSVAILERAVNFDVFKATVAARIHQIPKLRKRLVYVPMSVDYPYWVDDPDFNINLHIHHIALPKPGDWKQLRAVASRIFSEPLNKDRPLWQFTFVEGLDNVSQVPEGSVAIISKIHHVAIDGVAGAGILSLLFDMVPNTKTPPPPRPYTPEPIPNELTLIANSAMSFAKNPFKFPRLLRDTLSATVKASFLSRSQRMELPAAPFSAPPTQLNGRVSAQKKWNSVILELKRVKALKNIMGVTLNDVMLAICAGALRRYLSEKGKLPAKSLVAHVPVSIRNKGDSDTNKGNQISAMLIQLATEVEDPIERLEKINENTSRSKTYQKAIGAKTLSKIAETVPFGIANQAARIYSRYHLSEMHNPVFNVTITNVPGPQFPLYMAGHQLHTIMGSAPIIDGMGLIITIFSYNGKITISPTSDVNSMPDMDVFSRYLLESANNLEKAILEYQKKGKKKKTADDETIHSEVVIKAMRKFLKAQPEVAKSIEGIVEIQIFDKNAAWRIDFSQSPPSIRKGNAANPDTTLSIKDKYLLKIGQGSLNVQAAVIQGRLRATGDVSKAMKLGKIFKKMPKV